MEVWQAQNGVVGVAEILQSKSGERLSYEYLLNFTLSCSIALLRPRTSPDKKAPRLGSVARKALTPV